MIEKIVSSIVKKTVPKDFKTFNMQSFEGSSFTYNDFETSYEALPMMSEYKCVLLKDINFEKMNKSDLEKFQDLLDNINPSTVLIIYFVNLKVDAKKNAKIKKLCQSIEKKGVVCGFDFADQSTLRKTVHSYCVKNKAVIDKKATEQLINQTAAGYSVILNELDKLIHYANGDTITVDMVKKLCISSFESDAFDLSNAILQNKYQHAFVILNKLLYLKIEPILIMGAINRSFIDMYRIKSAQITGLSERDVVKDFKYRSSYIVTKLSRTVSKYSISQIRNFIKILSNTDTLLKSSQMDNKLILEQMIGQMMEIASKGRMI